MVLTVIVLMSIAWHGAEVVCKHGIGVESLPQSTAKGHSHSHGDRKQTEGSLQKQKRDHDSTPHSH